MKLPKQNTWSIVTVAFASCPSPGPAHTLAEAVLGLALGFSEARCPVSLGGDHGFFQLWFGRAMTGAGVGMIGFRVRGTPIRSWSQAEAQTRPLWFTTPGSASAISARWLTLPR